MLFCLILMLCWENNTCNIKYVAVLIFPTFRDLNENFYSCTASREPVQKQKKPARCYNAGFGMLLN